MSVNDVQAHARQVPGPADPDDWARFVSWLGREYRPEQDAAGLVTMEGSAGYGAPPSPGRVQASPGQWIIRTLGGAIHVAEVAA